MSCRFGVLVDVFGHRSVLRFRVSCRFGVWCLVDVFGHRCVLRFRVSFRFGVWWMFSVIAVSSGLR